MNSTHSKIGQFDEVNKLPNRESELVISARDDTGIPEGFETRYGAPIVGVTSHPEAIYGTESARNAFRKHPDAVEWSDNIFKGFGQSTRAYAAKQEVNAEIRRRFGPKEHDNS